MLASDPVFPIEFQIEQVTKLIEGILKRKNWKKFDVAAVKLVLTPFYFFYYDAAIEAQKDGLVVVKETKRGRAALDAESGELDPLILGKIPPDSKLVKELPETYPIEVQKSGFSTREAKKIAVLKTASMLQVGREDIVITDFKMIYCPIWVADITVAGQTHELTISASTGELLKEENVPVRIKGFVEVTEETLHELRKPGAWLHYTKEIAGDVAGFVAKKSIGKGKKAEAGGGSGWKLSMPPFFKRSDFIIIVALLVLLIIVMLYL